MISLPLQPGTIRLARFSALNYPPQPFGTLAKARKFSTTTCSCEALNPKPITSPHREPTKSSKQLAGEPENYKLWSRQRKRFPKTQKIAATKQIYRRELRHGVVLCSKGMARNSHAWLVESFNEHRKDIPGEKVTVMMKACAVSNTTA